MPPSQFFSHVTAAVIWGIPLPLVVLKSALIDISVFSPRRSPESSGTRGHQMPLHLAHTQVHRATGLRVASPASTWAMLGVTLHNPYDLIAAGDAVVREPGHVEDPSALTSIAQLELAVTAGRRQGIGALRRALPRVRVGSESRPETWTRLILVDDGLPEPVANFEVFHDGAWIARVDLAYPALKIAVEYEGEHHLLDPVQWARDLARYDRLAEAGWRVIRVAKQEIFGESSSLCARVRRAIAQASL